MSDGNGKREERFHNAFMIAAVNSAQGFLERAVAAKKPEQVLEALDAATDWITQARRTLTPGELPEGLSAPKLRPAPSPPALQPLDDD